MPPKKTKPKIPPLTPEEAAELMKRVDRVAANFVGQADELEAAIGMLMMGRLLGWKVLVLIHNKRTIRKYEEILDINVREFFEPEGALTPKSIGYSLAQKVGNFWKVVSGDTPVERRRELTAD